MDRQRNYREVDSIKGLQNQAVRQFSWLGFWTFTLLLIGLIIGLSARSENVKGAFSEHFDQGSFVVQYWPVVF